MNFFIVASAVSYLLDLANVFLFRFLIVTLLSVSGLFILLCTNLRSRNASVRMLLSQINEMRAS